MKKRGLVTVVAIRMHPDYFEALKRSIPTMKTGPQMDPRSLPIEINDAVDPHDPQIVERGYDGAISLTSLSTYEAEP